MKSINLGSENTFKSIIELAIPAMIAQLVGVLYNIVDRIYVGNIETYGSISLVGLGVCSPITTLISSFAFLVGLGGAPLFSIALGEKNEERSKQILSNAFLMLIVLSALIMLVFYLALDPMLYAFGASAESFPYAKKYMMIYLIGTFFSIISLGLNQFLTAQGNSFFAMMTTSISCLLNVGLDPLFLFAFHMGVEGAAIATVICLFISFGLTMFFILRKSRIKLSLGNYNLKLMGEILKLGFSPFIITATDSVVIILLNSTLQKYGEKDGDFYIEVATIVQAFETLVTGPLLGISSGTQPVLGFNYGAKNIPLIKKAEKQILLMAVVFTTLCFGFSFLLSKPFAQLFLGFSTSDYSEQIIIASVKYIQIYMYGIIPLAFQYVFVDGLTGMGQAKYSIWLSLNRKVILLIPAMILLPYLTHEASSCFYAELIADVVSGVVTSLVYLMLIKKILKKRLEEPINPAITKTSN